MTVLTLKYNIADLIDIYFGQGDHIYFFGPKTKRQSLFLVITLVAFPFFCFYSIREQNDWLLLIGTILFSLIIYDFIKVARPIIVWKKSVIRFLTEAEQVKKLEFHYDEISFIHIQDDYESKRDWSLVASATITDRLINIHAEKNFLLPRNALSKSEYDTLSEMIMAKVKNVTKD